MATIEQSKGRKPYPVEAVRRLAVNNKIRVCTKNEGKSSFYIKQ